MSNIEEEIFKRAKVDFNKLLNYGFIKQNNVYKISKNIMQDTFRIDFSVDERGKVIGKVYDLAFGDEYTNFYIKDSVGAFVGQVRTEYISFLEDIRDNCFIENYFINEQANRIASLIKAKYFDEPIFYWDKFPEDAVFRNKDTKKWYGIIMNIDKHKIIKNATGKVDILDIKLEPLKIENLLSKTGFFPAYHMNKKSWITIILDDTLTDDTIMELIHESYSYSIGSKNNSKNEWIVPANPKYFDIEKALKDCNIILWKQSTDVKINDLVYLYVASPYSSIMYKFKVVQANISYKYNDKNVKMRKVMRIELITRYKKGEFTFKKLKEFGVNAVRGPGYMPIALSKYINKSEEKN